MEPELAELASDARQPPEGHEGGVDLDDPEGCDKGHGGGKLDPVVQPKNAHKVVKENELGAGEFERRRKSEGGGVVVRVRSEGGTAGSLDSPRHALGRQSYVEGVRCHVADQSSDDHRAHGEVARDGREEARKAHEGQDEEVEKVVLLDGIAPQLQTHPVPGIPGILGRGGFLDDNAAYRFARLGGASHVHRRGRGVSIAARGMRVCVCVSLSLEVLSLEVGAAVVARLPLLR